MENILDQKYPALQGKVRYTRRTYYSKYVAKIESVLSNNLLWYWAGTHFKISDIFSNHKPENALSPFFAVRKRGRFYEKQSTIYFSKMEDADAFLNTFANFVQIAEIPACQEQEDLLKSDTKIRTRLSLYFSQYRYKIVFLRNNYNRTEAFKSVAEWVDAMFGERSERSFFRFHQCEPTLFLSDHDDLVMVKLAWHELIKQIECIKLISEMENQ
jgi:hypothetical protein